MPFRTPRSLSRRTVLAASPLGVLAGLSGRVALAQPAAADPVSFYLGQVLALATLQARSVGRLRPLLVSANPADGSWQAAASSEAGIIGAVASVLGGMEPPPELAASVGELRLASAAYQGAADAARAAAGGDPAALDITGARLAEGASHILLWLDALTAETGNDWGDGLRTLTEGTTPAPTEETPVEPVPVAPAEEAAEVEPVEEAPVEEAPIEVAPAEEEPANRQGRNRQNRQNQQNQPAEEQPDEEGQQNRQNRRNQQNRETQAPEE